MYTVLLFWQKLHYNVYKFNCFTQLYVFGLPVTLFLKNKYVIKQYNKRGVKNPSEIVRKTTTRPDVGAVNWGTDTYMILFIAMITFSFLNFVTAISGYMIWANWSFLIYLILIGVPSVLINYFALWKDDKYLVYYKEFEREPKEVKQKWAWISFGVVVGIILLLIASFWIMTERIQDKVYLSEKQIWDKLEKIEDSLYQGYPKDTIIENIETKLDKIEDSLYRHLKNNDPDNYGLSK